MADKKVEHPRYVIKYTVEQESIISIPPGPYSDDELKNMLWEKLSRRAVSIIQVSDHDGNVITKRAVMARNIGS